MKLNKKDLIKIFIRAMREGGCENIKVPGGVELNGKEKRKKRR